MIVVKATKDSEAGKFPQEKEKMFAAMATYHEKLEKAGVLLDASGLQPSSKGWRVKYTGGKRTVIDGPFIEAKELIAGYTIIQVKSREEALEWTKGFPNPVGEGAEAEIEVRQLYQVQDFGPSDAVESFRDIEAREKSQLATSNDEADIRTLIERWAKAVREENRADIRADHDHAILMFDVPPPFLSRGLDAYMATWETFFSSAEKPVVFAFHDVQVTCGQDVGFATAVGRCVNIDTNGKREPLEFRLTMGLRKLEGRWRVMHEHHSLPAT
jgi:ketosteroid isomerase-like protein